MLILANHLGLCACLKREGGASTSRISTRVEEIILWAVQQSFKWFNWAQTRLAKTFWHTCLLQDNFIYRQNAHAATSGSTALEGSIFGKKTWTWKHHLLSSSGNKQAAAYSRIQSHYRSLPFWLRPDKSRKVMNIMSPRRKATWCRSSSVPLSNGLSTSLTLQAGWFHIIKKYQEKEWVLWHRSLGQHTSISGHSKTM